MRDLVPSLTSVVMAPREPHPRPLSSQERGAQSGQRARRRARATPQRLPYGSPLPPLLWLPSPCGGGARGGSLLRAPAQRGRMHRRGPDLCQLVVQLDQRDGTAGHLERRDVTADQVARDANPLCCQDTIHLVVHHVELDERGAAHAVDEGEHAITRPEGKIFEDG